MHLTYCMIYEIYFDYFKRRAIFMVSKRNLRSKLETDAKRIPH